MKRLRAISAAFLYGNTTPSLCSVALFIFNRLKQLQFHRQYAIIKYDFTICEKQILPYILLFKKALDNTTQSLPMDFAAICLQIYFYQSSSLQTDTCVCSANFAAYYMKSTCCVTSYLYISALSATK